MNKMEWQKIQKINNLAKSLLEHGFANNSDEAYERAKKIVETEKK